MNLQISRKIKIDTPKVMSRSANFRCPTSSPTHPYYSISYKRELYESFSREIFFIVLGSILWQFSILGQQIELILKEPKFTHASLPGIAPRAKINLPVSRTSQKKSQKLRLGPKFFGVQLAHPSIRISLKATGKSFTNHFEKNKNRHPKTYV